MHYSVSDAATLYARLISYQASPLHTSYVGGSPRSRETAVALRSTDMAYGRVFGNNGTDSMKDYATARQRRPVQQYDAFSYREDLGRF